MAPSRKIPAPKPSPETTVYEVIHDHRIGSCRGQLIINHGSIAFAPAQATRHAFAWKLTDIIGTERADTLKIKFKHDTYRFKATLARDKADNQAKLAAIDQALTRGRLEVEIAKK